MDQYIIHLDESKTKTKNFSKKFSLEILQGYFGILIF